MHGVNIIQTVTVESLYNMMRGRHTYYNSMYNIILYDAYVWIADNKTNNTKFIYLYSRWL